MSRPGPRTVTVRGAIWSTGDGMTTDDETEAANQMEAAAEAIREAVLGLLEAGEGDPQFVVMAAARGTGELGADIARIGGGGLGMVLGGLADLGQEAGGGAGGGVSGG